MLISINTRLPANTSTPRVSVNDTANLLVYLDAIDSPAMRERFGKEHIVKHYTNIIVTKGNRFKSSDVSAIGGRYIYCNEKGEHVGALNYTTIQRVTSVSNIYVRPDYRRQGIATLLVNAAKQDYPKLKVDSNMTNTGGKFFGYSMSSSYKRYLKMFESLPEYEQYKSRYVEYIRKFTSVLKKQDRVVYMCKLLKFCFIKHFVGKRQLKAKDATALLEKLKLKDSAINFREIDELLKAMRHVYDLQIPKVNSYVISNQSIDELLDFFHSAEEEWRDDKDLRTVKEKGKKIIEFSDGSAWFNLGSSTDSDEAIAMKNCGNDSALRKNTDRILSYREYDKNSGLWTPKLTFVINAGVLSEMRGFANAKPSAKYHPMIYALLMSKQVKGVSLVRHRAANNFELSDFSRPLQEQCLAKKPMLASIQMLINSCRSTKDFEEIAKRLNVKNINGSQCLLASDISSIKEFAAACNLEILTKCEYDRNVYKDSYHDSYDMYAYSILQELEKYYPIKFEILVHKYNTDDLHLILHKIKDDKLLQKIEDAARKGNELGVLNAIKKAREECLEANKIVIKDSVYKLWLALDKVILLLQQVTSYNEWIDSKKNLFDHCLEVDKIKTLRVVRLQDAIEPSGGFNSQYDLTSAVHYFQQAI